jgi:hypothetical protein
MIVVSNRRGAVKRLGAGVVRLDCRKDGVAYPVWSWGNYREITPTLLSS